MNYYEELGVSRSASTAEIRQAYKALVRLLHPDQQQEKELKRLSELQLRRLNHLLEVLSDPLQRRQYDLGLERLLPAAVPSEMPQKLSLAELRGIRIRFRLTPGALVWLLIAGIAIATGVFWIRSPEPVYSEPVRGNASRPVEQAPVAADAPSAPSSVPAPAVAEKHHAFRPEPEPTQPRAGYPERASNTPTSDRRLNEPPPPVMVAVEPAKEALPALPPVAAQAVERSVSGKWLYVPQHDETKKGMYAPEYIELRITRRAGLLHGKYHGKYRVSDRPISSEVNFQFEGKPGDAVSVLPWFATNGSKGEVRLKRLSDDSMEVNWVTTSFGNSNTLASGTAVLYRSDLP